VAVRTYIDSGVLISALRGGGTVGPTAQSFLYDPLREYVTSDYVKIELLPKSIFYRNEEEREFYQGFFSSTKLYVPNSDELLAFALDHGGRTGISGIDAIHVACALIAGAAELITSEKPTKPIHRASGIKVISINP